MKGFDAYRCHQAMSLHFNKKTNYDYFKYNGSVSVKEDNFKKHKNKWQYVGIEDKVDQILWFYYNAYKSNKFAYTTIQYIMAYLRSKKCLSKDAMIENIKRDLEYLSVKYKDDPYSITDVDDLYPALYNEYDDGSVQLETFLLFDLKIVKLLHIERSDDIIGWPKIIKDMELVQPFVNELLSDFDFVKSFEEIYLNK